VRPKETGGFGRKGRSPGRLLLARGQILPYVHLEAGADLTRPNHGAPRVVSPPSRQCTIHATQPSLVMATRCVSECTRLYKDTANVPHRHSLPIVGSLLASVARSLQLDESSGTASSEAYPLLAPTLGPALAPLRPDSQEQNNE
jgi:hypothetical protein